MKNYALSRLVRRCSPLLIASAMAGVLSAASGDDALAAQKGFTCTPADVATFMSRIHVRCAPGDGAIQYFAVRTSNSDDADRFLSISATALALKKKLFIFYDPNDLGGASVGCLTSDCRLMVGAVMF